MLRLLLLISGLLLGGGAAGSRPALAAAEGKVRFNRDVRPILSEKCFRCHGPDANARQADLRLDRRAEALAERRGSPPAIVPGQPARSELVRRITHPDREERMPPERSNKTLTPAEIDILRRWIEEGAAYEGHWAFIPPVRPAIPAAGSRPRARGAADAFILERLEAEGLGPSPEADRRSLARRLAFDLTGLPPRPEESDAFAADAAPDACERVIDRLLASPAYGERLAIHWLDLVRYADSVGYHGDQEYSVFPYRDYVLNAFNANLPFDRFTVEQLAGDLLPGATRDQKVASGYNRLNMITAEGGAQDKEYRVKYAADRVRTTATVWLGATIGCAECHDHKFDPYTAKDFYSFSAFFADLSEFGFYPRGYPFGDWGPQVLVPDAGEEAALARLDAEVAAAKAAAGTMTPELEAAQAAWEAGPARLEPPAPGPWHAAGPFTAASAEAAFRETFPPEGGVDLAAAYDGGRVRWEARPEWKDGKVHALKQGENAATYLHRTITVKEAQPLALALGSDDAIKVWHNGREVLSRFVLRAAAPDQERLQLDLEPGENRLLVKIVNAASTSSFYFKAADAVPDEVRKVLGTPAGERGEAEKAKVRDYFLSVTPLLAGARARLAELGGKREALVKTIPTTLVSMAVAPRVMRILPRGNWMDDSGPEVAPAVPGFFRGIVREGRADRLDLARWLVSPENPLLARAVANRLWKLFFGTGLSRVLDDLGAQGEWPTHPDLLDWLAVEFVESGWDVKRLVRRMVASSAYRQSSLASPEVRGRDPYNRLLARQTSTRLPAEMVRDNALAVSGLLVYQLGGKSIKPYQPEGYWDQLNFPRRTYERDPGAAQYRRGVYCHWQRTFLHPSMVAFDAAGRQECTAERGQSNTPLQALVLLNDPTFVEAARAFAERVVRDGGRTVAERLAFAFREALCRPPEAREAAVLADLLETTRAEYAARPEAARQLLTVGLKPAAAGLEAVEVASWCAVTRAILNLHESITRY